MAGNAGLALGELRRHGGRRALREVLVLRQRLAAAGSTEDGGGDDDIRGALHGSAHVGPTLPSATHVAAGSSKGHSGDNASHDGATAEMRRALRAGEALVRALGASDKAQLQLKQA